MVQGLGFGVWGSGFRFQGLGFRIYMAPLLPCMSLRTALCVLHLALTWPRVLVGHPPVGRRGLRLRGQGGVVPVGGCDSHAAHVPCLLRRLWVGPLGAQL